MTMSAYNDRICTPEQTLDTIGPHLGHYGITRIARQTSLDVIGIPVFAAIRPNAATLATSQGKGLSDGAAKASAAMEALEYAVAERPECPKIRATAEALLADGHAVYTATTTLPLAAAFPLDREISWVEGEDVFSGSRVYVPLDLVALRGVAEDLVGLCQNTNGLASGNTAEEALFHALCELVERDAGSLWSLMSARERQERAVCSAAFNDPEVDRLAKAIAQAGLELRLFDQTSDLNIPTLYAEIGPPAGQALHQHETSSGAGTHPVAARAALRAITEAAQSRVTAIAAARDDMPASLYRPGAGSGLEQGTEQRPALAGLPLGTPLAVLLTHMRDTLMRHGVDRLVGVRLGGAVAGVVVLKVLSDQLEDVGVNLHWRPGRRALGFLAGRSI